MVKSWGRGSFMSDFKIVIIVECVPYRKVVESRLL